MSCDAMWVPIQTGNENNVERLMKQISSFMTEISDEFKTVVVEAIHSLCLKFPRKHHVLMTFLANMLRNEVRSVATATCIILAYREEQTTRRLLSIL